MTTIVIPYVSSMAKKNEILYALRSIAKNADFEKQIVIVGDLPEFINPETVIHVPHTRLVGIPENCTADGISKILAFLDSEYVDGDFIRTYDDVIWMKPTKLDDLKKQLVHFSYKGVDRTKYEPTTWRKQLWRTIDALEAKGSTIYNCETHAPYLFEPEALRETISEFKAFENRLLIRTLYANTHMLTSKSRPKKVSECQEICMFNADAIAKDPNGDIAKQADGYRWLNFNDDGLTDKIYRFIAEQFPEPCEYEK